MAAAVVAALSIPRASFRCRRQSRRSPSSSSSSSSLRRSGPPRELDLEVKETRELLRGQRGHPVSQSRDLGAEEELLLLLLLLRRR